MGFGCNLKATTVPQRIRVLIVEDSSDDAELIILALRHAGFDSDWGRVETADELRNALRCETWDVVLSDYTLPQFGAMAALQVVNGVDPDLPFIVISGTVGEEIAVELMRAGARDYVLKHNLLRLTAAVERELRESGSRRSRRVAEREALQLAAVVQSSDDAIISETPDGLIASWNAGATRLFGWTPAEVVGKSVLILVPDDRMAEFHESMDAVRQTGIAQRQETVRLRKDGSRVDVSITISPIRDGHDQLVGFSRVARDISSRKKSEVESRLLMSIIEYSPDFICIAGINQDVVFINQAGQVLVGLKTADQVSGSALIDYFPEHARPYVERDVLPLVVATGLWAGELPVRNLETGAAVQLEWKMFTVPDPDTGRVAYLACVARDITERLSAQAEQTRMANLLRAVSDSIPDAVFIKDREGRYLLFNPAASRFVGRPVDDVLGRDDSVLFSPADALRIRERDLHVMESKQADTAEEQLTAAGVTRTYLATKAPYYDRQGRVIGVIGISRDITDSKRAEEALRLSEARFRGAMEQASIGMALVGPRGNWLQVNRALCQIVGYSESELLSTTFQEITHPDDLQEDLSQVARLLSGEIPTFQLEKRYIHKAGHTVYILLNVSLVRDPAGRPLYFIAQIQDINDRKRIEAERDELLSQLQLQIERMPIAYIVFDADLTYTGWNPAAEKIFGYTRDEILGQDLMVLVPPGTRAHIADVRDRLCTGDGTAHSINLNLTKDGSLITCEWHNTPLTKADGEFIGVLSMVIDVTEQFRVQEALRLRDRAIRAVTLGIVITDAGQPSTPIVYVSPGFERMTGYDGDAILGRELAFLQGEDTDAAAVTRLRDAIAAGAECTVELLNYRRDGIPFWDEISISPVRDAMDRLTHFVEVHADVTARRKLEEQFRQAQKMEAFGQLAGGVAHDFNNLLTVINGYSDLLLEDTPADDPARELLVQIHRAGERSAALTRQLLMFSRKQIVAPRALDLNTVVIDAEKMLRRLIGEDILLTTRLARELWSVRADPGQIEQMLLNLVVNGRDAMPTGGRIEIETHNVYLDKNYVLAHADAIVGPHVMVSVTDTGSGMTPEVRVRIFEPFFTTKQPGKGTGLGLATVYGIVRDAGGHIAVNTELGVGTRFEVYFPRGEATDGDIATSSRPCTAPRGTETVLIVEDEEGVRCIVQRILRAGGYTVLTASSGDEATQIASEYAHPIDLLISDVVMPVSGGRNVAERVTAVKPGIRVLFVSGYTDDAVVRHGILLDEVNFLQKPFSSTELAFKVREVLDAPA